VLGNRLLIGLRLCQSHGPVRFPLKEGEDVGVKASVVAQGNLLGLRMDFQE
jgi:hypothetical protein